MIPPARDKLLLTPGPLTTSQTVKQAMLRDYGSRDRAFIERVADIRRRLLGLGGVASPDYEAVLMQGSGTYAVESVFSSCVPPDGRVLLVVNGAYGRRMVRICEVLRIAAEVEVFPENATLDLRRIEQRLQRSRGVTHVAAVHCETSTGMFNPVEVLGALAAAAGARFVVDAMSSFAAVPLDLDKAHIDYLVSSANKCIEGVPGFAFVLARRAALLESRGWARSLSLDLLAQWEGLEANGQFRFTPPTHALAAFHQALLELEAEGGVAGRAARYRTNYETLVAGMRALGFEEYLDPALQGYIITSYRYPATARWDFEQFYQQLSARGFVIYPGKTSDADCFRIGNIGRIFPEDIRALLAAVRDVVMEMGMDLMGDVGPN
ncbi:MAG: 2-aminoethylphosphonate--pyruvate transaminase [Candidatus Hydrogenedentes bacterium]|nr:2-aminoethylphosphonate--pyruvate transaminase [Candidatus Hydrogenedentota bacterium]